MLTIFTTWLMGKFGKLGVYAGAIGAVILAILTYGWKKKREGHAEALEEMEAETDRQVKKGEDIARDVEEMSDEDVQKELEDEWSRD